MLASSSWFHPVVCMSSLELFLTAFLSELFYSVKTKQPSLKPRYVRLSIPRWVCSICGRRSTRCWSSTTTPWPWRCPSCGRGRWCRLPGPTPQTQRNWSSSSRRLSLIAGQLLHLALWAHAVSGFSWRNLRSKFSENAIWNKKFAYAFFESELLCFAETDVLN